MLTLLLISIQPSSKLIKAMTYDQAHNILHNLNPEDANFKVPPPLTAGDAVDKSQIKNLKHDLSLLTQLTRKLKKRRETEGGAVDLSSGDRGSELKFVLDDAGNPTKVVPKQELEIHHTIAELMIMANSFVAETIYKHFPDTSLLRIHGSAKVDNFEELESLLKASGTSFDGKSNKALAKSLNDARARGLGSIQDNLFQSLATRAMSEAQYVCTGALGGDGSLSHYGLGIDLYTHFTSPIRRYADVIVHRLLLESLSEKVSLASTIGTLDNRAIDNFQSLIPDSNAISVLNGEGIKPGRGLASDSDSNSDDNDDDADDFLDSLIEGAEELALGESKNDEDESIHSNHVDANSTSLKVSLYQTTELAKTCDILNLQNRTAKLSSMQCQRLFLSLYFRQNIEETDAIVVGLKQNGVIVYVPKFDMKGPLFLADKDGNVHVDPKFFGLPPSIGFDPSPKFVGAEGCRMFPDGQCSIQDEYDESKAKVLLRLPSNKSEISFRRLDVVTVRLSCDVSNVVARIPPPNIQLISTSRSTSSAPSNHVLVQKVSRKDSKLPSAQMDSPKMHQSSLDNSSSYSPKQSEPRSMFDVLCSIPNNASLTLAPYRMDVDSRKKRKKKTIERVQTIKGRIYMNSFNAYKFEGESIDGDADVNHNGETSLAAQAAIGDYDASKRIEREATARMQRIAAERRNAKRTRAMKRK